MLALDDPRWASLTHAYRSAADTPGVLAQFRTELLAGKVSTEVSEKLFSSLLHQGDVYPATVFALPHVVAAAREASAEQRRLAIYFAAHAARGFDGENRADYADADAWSEFDDAIVAARPLSIATARTAKGDDVLPDLWMVADIHGWHPIARAIEGLMDGGADMECPSCGGDLTVDFTDLDVDPEEPAPVPLEQLAALAKEANAPEEAQRVLDLRGSLPCPHCDEHVLVARL